MFLQKLSTRLNFEPCTSHAPVCVCWKLFASTRQQQQHLNTSKDVYVVVTTQDPMMLNTHTHTHNISQHYRHIQRWSVCECVEQLTTLHCKSNEGIVLLNVPLQNVSTATKDTLKPGKIKITLYIWSKETVSDTCKSKQKLADFAIKYCVIPVVELVK